MSTKPSTAATRPLTAEQLRKARDRHAGPGAKVMAWVLRACAAVSGLTTVAIVILLGWQTVLFFREVGVWAFLADTQWTPLYAEKHFGIWPLLCATLGTAGVASLFAIPVGILTAVYLSEYAPKGWRRGLKLGLDLIAGVPSIVFGYLALSVVTPLIQTLRPSIAPFNGLAASLAMGVMVVPIVAALSEDAIQGVPSGLREAAYALGANRWRTIFGVVLPTARRGLLAASLLGVARAIGETMIVAIAAGQQARLTASPFVPIETLTAYILQISLGDVAVGTLEFRTIYAVGTTLFCLTFVLNAISQALRGREQRRRAS